MVTDPLNLLYRPKLDSEGFPRIPRPETAPVPSALYEYTLKRWPKTGAAQFFSRPAALETIWREAARYGKVFAGRTVVSPLFPFRAAWPEPVQRWNVYRSRWIAAYWSTLGVRLIPSVQWDGEDSFYFAFCGLPQKTILAINCHNGVTDKKGFQRGIEALFRVFDPPCILCYGHFERHYGGTHEQVIAYTQRGRHREPEQLPTVIAYEYC